jgi:hypothetical protein
MHSESDSPAFSGARSPPRSGSTFSDSSSTSGYPSNSGLSSTPGLSTISDYTSTTPTTVHSPYPRSTFSNVAEDRRYGVTGYNGSARDDTISPAARSDSANVRPATTASMISSATPNKMKVDEETRYRAVRNHCLCQQSQIRSLRLHRSSSTCTRKQVPCDGSSPVMGSLLLHQAF